MTLPERSSVSAGQVETWFKHYVAKLTGVGADDIDANADFESFGIDSLQAVDMTVALETWLGMPDDLPMELLFEASSLADAARSVAEAQNIRVAP